MWPLSHRRCKGCGVGLPAAQEPVCHNQASHHRCLRRLIEGISGAESASGAVAAFADMVADRMPLIALGSGTDQARNQAPWSTDTARHNLIGRSHGRLHWYACMPAVACSTISLQAQATAAQLRTAQGAQSVRHVPGVRRRTCGRMPWCRSSPSGLPSQWPAPLPWR